MGALAPLRLEGNTSSVLEVKPNKEGRPMPALLTIGEVARRAGVGASAIRYYEEAGLLPEPERVGGKLSADIRWTEQRENYLQNSQHQYLCAFVCVN